MILDKTTLHDLSFLQGEHSVFALINQCTTQAGSDVLKKIVQMPPSDFEKLREQQDAVKFWMQYPDAWTSKISNGTLVMIEKFYESADAFHGKSNSIGLFMNSVMQKLFNRNAYSFVRFSISHLIDFLKGCNELVVLLEHRPPKIIAVILESFKEVIALPLCRELVNTSDNAPQPQLLELSYKARREIKHIVLQMIDRYAKLDALQSMANVTLKKGWTMPELKPSALLQYQAEQLHHPLLKNPVAYDINYSKEQNFLFLTGANMSGKSTLIRAMGVGALLAHLGMGVPAKSMQISFLEGIVTNMQVEDNIFLGESYFFAEVQRMKLTAQKLNKNRYYLVLMDELFKGTNVHDAYECSRAVIDGLLKQKDNLMALSTHLNELSENLKTQPNVWFRYCYTDITTNGQYTFTYQLKEGVSKDRIGYLVLRNEGVLDLLKA
ncbi:DNA mismatch repair protein MutS [Taibaiella lutea]|uniref:DNA mismatch repair protein MutS n=1 Tax=Taibaiella lutea TaxID=2608001 RepID=A0A5M6CQJ3_9BACT|nr:DNA mismatch repair protein MutS [Taibaiella lutea]KAA5537387.1 DNA mismatch repair protein MutS [Taibaiella lutea]